MSGTSHRWQLTVSTHIRKHKRATTRWVYTPPWSLHHCSQNIQASVQRAMTRCRATTLMRTHHFTLVWWEHIMSVVLHGRICTRWPWHGRGAWGQTKHGVIIHHVYGIQHPHRHDARITDKFTLPGDVISNSSVIAAVDTQWTSTHVTMTYIVEGEYCRMAQSTMLTLARTHVWWTSSTNSSCITCWRTILLICWGLIIILMRLTLI